MTIGKAIGASLVEEVNVFDQQAEERNHNLGGNTQRGISTRTTMKAQERERSEAPRLREAVQIQNTTYSLSAAVSCLRAVGGSPERCSVVVEVSGGIHLMLSKQNTQKCV